MDNVYLVITAQAVLPDQNEGQPGENDPLLGGILHKDNFCRVLLGVIEKICSTMNVPTLHSECYAKKNRFALMVRADAKECSEPLDNLRKALETAGRKLGTTVRVQKEDLFRYMHRI